jgi:hypothetical protein
MVRDYTYKERCQQCEYYQRGNIYRHPVKNFGGCALREEAVSASMTACDEYLPRGGVRNKEEKKMDPDANIEEQFRLVRGLRVGVENGHVGFLDVSRLCDLIEALDEWLGSGKGFLPERWNK